MDTSIQQIPFTQEAFDKIHADFNTLTAERVEVMARLKTAREMGDLSENGAYQYAKFELGRINRELARLRHLIKNGYVQAKKSDSSTADFGCTVTLSDGKKQMTYMLVSLHESNPQEGKISTDSPIGQAILGKKVGDTVNVTTPRGTVTFSIVNIV